MRRLERLDSAWLQGSPAFEPSSPLEFDERVEVVENPSRRTRTALTEKEVEAIGTAREGGKSMMAIAKRFGIHRATVWEQTRRYVVTPSRWRGCGPGPRSQVFVGCRVGAACPAYPTVVGGPGCLPSVRVLGSMCTPDPSQQRRSMVSQASCSKRSCRRASTGSGHGSPIYRARPRWPTKPGRRDSACTGR